ncbi:Leucine rich repeat protein [Entamoeba marina]
MNNKQVDSYSALIISKYLENSEDFINLICVNSKFRETTEKLRFNPIPITSLKLFPKIQTQYLYNEYDIILEGIDNYEKFYEINYDQYLKFKKDNTKYHNVIYTYENRKRFGDVIPDGVTIIGYRSFGSRFFMERRESTIKESIIPLPIKSLGEECFNHCFSLTSLNLPSTITSLGNGCFFKCQSLKLINLPSSLTSISNRCFEYCGSLTSINLPSGLIKLGDGCFYWCRSLQSINLPSTLTSLGSGCFGICRSLTLITIPTTIKVFREGCFYGCDQINNIIIVPNKCFDEPIPF